MIEIHRHPAHRLHTLVARLDDAAESFLRERFDISYARYLTLVTVDRLGGPTHRELASAQGVSEPATSRMVAALVTTGHLASEHTPGDGNRRTVRLTSSGRTLLGEAGELLETRFAELADAAGVEPRDLLALTDRLLAVLAPVPEGAVP